MNLRERSYQKEQLDNLELSGKTLHKTLDSLKWINKFFGNHKQLGTAVLRYAKKNRDTNDPIKIVDLGCGGGDSLIAISKKLQEHGISAQCIGIDGNAESIAHARNRITNSNHIQYEVDDILNPNFEPPSCDLIICSHFIYHFGDNNLVLFLKKLTKLKVKALIFSELYRSPLAFHLFRVSHLILPISKMAKLDGLLAIQRAFTISEMQSILDEASLKKQSVKKKFWFRMLASAEVS